MAETETQVATFRARRRLDIHPGFREPGELVPEAHTWFRRESWLHTGYLEEATVGEKEFRAAVHKYVKDKDEVASILERAGLDDNVRLEGPMGMPYRHTTPAPLKPAKAPAKVPPKTAGKPKA